MRIAPITAAASSAVTATGCPPATSPNAMSMDSLDTKPRVGGTAAMAAAPSTVAPNAHGMRRHSGPRSRMSRAPASWSITPTSMNRPDLNRAWATVCSAAAASASCVPTPIAAVIHPSWLTVE